MIWECYGIYSALFNCGNEVYNSPFLQKLFPCVALQVSFNIFSVLNHLGSVYGDDDVSFVQIKNFHTVLSRKYLWPCAVTSLDTKKVSWIWILSNRRIFFLFFFILLFFTTVVIITTVWAVKDETSIWRSKVNLLFSLIWDSFDFFMRSQHIWPAFLALIPLSYTFLNPFKTFFRPLQPHSSSHNWEKYENSQFNSVASGYI